MLRGTSTSAVLAALTLGLCLAGPSADGSLIAHYALDEGADLVAGDVVDGHHGALSGAVAWDGGGMAGGALAFAGGQVDVPATLLASVDANDQISVALWIKPASLSSYTTIFDSPGRQLSLWINGATDGWCGAGGDSTGLSFNPGWTLDEWQHLAFVYDQQTSNLKTYRNGQCNGQANVSGQNFSDVWVWAGNPSGGGSAYLGLMDDVQVYDQVFSDADTAWLADHPGQVLPEPAGALILLAGAAAKVIRRRR